MWIITCPRLRFSIENISTSAQNHYGVNVQIYGFMLWNHTHMHSHSCGLYSADMKNFAYIYKNFHIILSYYFRLQYDKMSIIYKSNQSIEMIYIWNVKHRLSESIETHTQPNSHIATYSHVIKSIEFWKIS